MGLPEGSAQDISIRDEYPLACKNFYDALASIGIDHRTALNLFYINYVGYGFGGFLKFIEERGGVHEAFHALVDGFPHDFELDDIGAIVHSALLSEGYILIDRDRIVLNPYMVALDKKDKNRTYLRGPVINIKDREEAILRHLQMRKLRLEARELELRIARLREGLPDVVA